MWINWYIINELINEGMIDGLNCYARLSLKGTSAIYVGSNSLSLGILVPGREIL